MSRFDRSNADEFDVGKAVAAVSYLIQKTGESMYPILKMVYLADKFHLERYGRLISGDNYVAMKQGPVPSRAYDIFKALRGSADSGEAEIAGCYLRYVGEHDYEVVRAPDLDELSASDLECLDETVATYSRLGKWTIRDLAHDAAWDAAWPSVRFRKAFPMSAAHIANFLDADGQLIEHLKDRSPGEATAPGVNQASRA